jgi:hypothetical protein
MNLEGLGIKRQILFKNAALIMPQEKLRARKTTKMYQCNVLELHTMINVHKANKILLQCLRTNAGTVSTN